MKKLWLLFFLLSALLVPAGTATADQLPPVPAACQPIADEIERLEAERRDLGEELGTAPPQ